MAWKLSIRQKTDLGILAPAPLAHPVGGADCGDGGAKGRRGSRPFQRFRLHLFCPGAGGGTMGLRQSSWGLACIGNQGNVTGKQRQFWTAFSPPPLTLTITRKHLSRLLCQGQRGPVAWNKTRPAGPSRPQTSRFSTPGARPANRGCRLTGPS